MRKFIKPIGIAGIAVAASFAAQAAEETFQASVEVLAPITITETQAMSFGRIIAPTNGSPNTYDTSGTVTGTGDGSYVSGASDATITISGDSGGASFDYSVSDTGSCTSASLTLTVNESGTGNNNWAAVVPGTLDVASGTAAGSYTCDYTVTANYQ